jgi:hypothetical protein
LGQCGGTGYKGPTNCVSNLTCYVRDSLHSSCSTYCPKNWQCVENGKIIYLKRCIYGTQKLWHKKLKKIETLFLYPEDFTDNDT